MRKRLLVGAAVSAVVAVAGYFAYFELLKKGFIRYGKYDRRDRGSLRVGAVAPDLDLTMYDGSPVRLSRLWQPRPLFLVFGSCT